MSQPARTPTTRPRSTTFTTGGFGAPGESERRPQWWELTRASAKRLTVAAVMAALILMITVWAFHALSSFLFLLLLAWLLSIAMEPMVQWLSLIHI